MKLNSKTTPQWFDRGSLMALGAALIAASASADPNSGAPSEDSAVLSALAAPAPATNSLHEALAGGSFWVNLRYRFESVEQDGFLKDGRASTLQTRLGYETGEFRGLTGVLEFSDVARVPSSYEDYNDGSAGSTSTRPGIADPDGTVMNQAYVRYSGALKGDFKLGRQRIQLGNERFIGNVGWRQTEQTFDAISYSSTFGSGISVYYGYLDRANTINQVNQDQDSHILNLDLALENIGTVTAYGYYLDFPGAVDMSTFTYGGRFVGDNNQGNWSMLYGLELAHQEDIGDNGFDVAAEYSQAHLGAKVAGVTVKVGFESLEGSPDASDERAFQTPLATKFAHNGWADKFLRTDEDGLEDTFFHVGYEQGAFSAAVIFHDFDRERSSGGSYGSEVDALLTYKVNDDMTLGLRAADFNADDSTANTADGLTDTQKLWFWLGYSW